MYSNTSNESGNPHYLPHFNYDYQQAKTQSMNSNPVLPQISLMHSIPLSYYGNNYQNQSQYSQLNQQQQQQQQHHHQHQNQQHNYPLQQQYPQQPHSQQPQVHSQYVNQGQPQTNPNQGFYQGLTSNHQLQPIQMSRAPQQQYQQQYQSLSYPPLQPPLMNINETESPPSSQSTSGTLVMPENTKFTYEDAEVLKRLLPMGEKYKWKQITRNINLEAARRRNETYVDENGGSNKNVSPTFVIKQYQALLGLPSNQLYFGLIGSSLPYVMTENGWDDINIDDINVDDVE